MNISSRLMAVLVSVVLILSVCELPASAFGEERFSGFERPVLYNEPIGSETAEFISEIDYDALREVLVEGFSQGQTRIDISSFNFTTADADGVFNIIWYNMPEAFIVAGLGYWTSGSKIVALSVSYRSGFPDYAAALASYESAADKLLAGIEGNDSLGEVEKALLIHDRIDAWCEYDYGAYTTGTISDTSYTMYGVLVNKVAVCMGYALAYKYLLDRVGVRNYYVASDALNHAWNMVYIDGVKYQVDTTWDDPTVDVSGRAMHTNFLQSTARFSQAHNANDYDSTATSTRFDNAWWSSVETSFQLIDGYIYYILRNSTQQSIYRTPCNTVADNTDDVVIKTFSATWMVSQNSYYTVSSKLSSDGRSLFYSNPDNKIYKLDVKTNTEMVFHQPNISVAYTHPYGFCYDGKTLVTEISSSPYFSSQSEKTASQKKITQTDSATCGSGKHIPYISGGVTAPTDSACGHLGKVECYACGQVLQQNIAVNQNVLVDINSDGVYDSSDFSVVVNACLQGGNQFVTTFDFNFDGFVDVLDVVMSERVMHTTITPRNDYSLKIETVSNQTALLYVLKNILGIGSATATTHCKVGAVILSGRDYPSLYRAAHYINQAGNTAGIYYGLTKIA